MFGRGSGQTAMHWAAESGHSDVVKLLYSHCAELPTSLDERGRSAADVAEGAIQGKTEGVLRAITAEPYVCIRIRAESSHAVRSHAGRGGRPDGDTPLMNSMSDK